MFVTLIQEVVDHITQLVYAGSIFADYYSLELLESGEELPVITQGLFSIFSGQGETCPLIISRRASSPFCESLTLNQSEGYTLSLSVNLVVRCEIAMSMKALVLLLRGPSKDERCSWI